MHNFRDFNVWQIGMNLLKNIFRRTDRDFSKFLAISIRSPYELETQWIANKSTSLLSEDVMKDLVNKLNEIQRMTRTLINKTLYVFRL